MSILTNWRIWATEHYPLLDSILTPQGWNIEELVRYGSCTKSYDTAVGPRQAVIHVYIPNNSDRAWFLADYQSEGRNVLANCSNGIKIGSLEDFRVQLTRLLKELDAAVDDSYARRLLIKHGITP